MGISIVVPVYNAEKYLHQCIESIIAQTEQVIEIILVNDGSTDGSLSICQKYAKIDSRITVINQANQGVSVARNTGIQEATSEYVMFVDSDDYIEANMCERLLQEATQHNSDLVMCRYRRTSEDKNDNTRQPKYLPIVCVEDLAGENFVFFYLHDMFNAPVCKLYRHELIKKPFDKGLSIGEDLIFNLEYLKNCSRVNYISEQLYHYRVGDAHTLSTRYFDQRIDEIYQVFQQSKVLFEELFGDGVAVTFVETKFIQEVCLSIRKLLVQSNYSFEEKKQRLNNWHSKFEIEKWAHTEVVRHLNLPYRVFFELYAKKRYRLLQLITYIQNNLKRGAR